VEGVCSGAAMSRRIGQRLDQFELLDDGARPAVGDDDGQGILVFRAHVNEVDVEPVDLGDEVGRRIDARLDLAPVIFGGPVLCELPDRGERHALREIRDRFALGQTRRRDAAAQLRQLRLRNVDTKRSNRRVARGFVALSPCSGGWCHADLLVAGMTPDARGRIHWTLVSAIPS
jgi:hypothetical protein